MERTISASVGSGETSGPPGADPDPGGKSSRIVHDGIGHAPFIEDAKRFNGDLKKFVSGL